MSLHPNKHLNFFLCLAYTVLIVAGVYLGFKYLLGWLMPLIFAFLLSRFIIRPVNYLSSKLKWLSRSFASAVGTLLIVTFVGGLLYLIIATLVHEGILLYNSLPELLASIPKSLDSIQLHFDKLFARLPDWLHDTQFFSISSWLQSVSLPDINVAAILSKVGGAALSVPTIIITTVFVFVGTFFLTSDNDEISHFIARQLGEHRMSALLRLTGFLKSSVVQWVKAQGILICVTFSILLVGFLVLRLPYALLLAMLIAIIDALPILGVGTVLIPWAIICLLLGNFVLAISLCVLYALVLIVRNSIEPHIVGGRIGLHPFITLLTIYFGFRMAGFAGMFLLPVLVLSAIKLQEWGYIKIWK